MLESALERRLAARAKISGGWAIKITSPAQAGLPDRLVIKRDGRVVWVELKTPRGRVSAIQAKVHTRLRGLGQDVRVVRTAEECDALFD